MLKPIFGFLMSVLILGQAMAQDTRFQSRPIGLMPEAVTSFGAASDGHWLYVLGGAKGVPHKYDSDSQSPIFARMNLHNPSDWQLLPKTTALQSVALVQHENMLYRIGGMRSLNKPGTEQENTSVAEFARFLPNTMEWELLPHLPRGRSSHDAVVIGNSIYVVGGWHLEGGSEADEWAKDVLSFDLTNIEGQWQKVCDAPFRRRAIAVAHAEKNLYAMGGIDEDGETSACVDIFNLETKTWSKGPQIPARGIKGFGMSAFGSGDYIIASAADGLVRLLGKDAKSWKTVGQHTFHRFFHRLITDHKGGFLVAGGSGKEGRIRHIEHLTPSKNSQQKPVTTVFEIPFPGKSKNRQGMFLKGQELHMFGGNNSLGQHDFEEENFVSESWVVDLATMTVKPSTNFPVPRQSMMTLTESKGRQTVGWAFGGFGYAEDGAKTFSELRKFDFKRKEWLGFEGKIPNRSQAGLVLRHDGLWVFGGLDYDPSREEDKEFHHPKEVVRVAMHKEQESKEQVVTQLPSQRRAFGGALINGHYVMVGGMKENFKAVDTCDVFDFESQEWSQIAKPKYARLNPQLVQLNGKLILAGGTAKIDGKRRSVAEIEMFDPKTQTWSILLDQAPIPTRHMRMFAFQGSLLLVSTHNKDSLLKLCLVRPGINMSTPSSRPSQGRK